MSVLHDLLAHVVRCDKGCGWIHDSISVDCPEGLRLLTAGLRAVSQDQQGDPLAEARQRLAGFAPAQLTAQGPQDDATYLLCTDDGTDVARVWGADLESVAPLAHLLAHAPTDLGAAIAEVDQLRAEVQRLTDAAARQYDLIRYARWKLHDEALITDAEYEALAADRSPIARLEGYDAVRAAAQRLVRDEYTSPDQGSGPSTCTHGQSAPCRECDLRVVGVSRG